MKILIIHQVPYRKIQYHRALDHDVHDITYVGLEDRLADVPQSLKCRKLTLPDDGGLVEGVIAVTSAQDGYEAVLALSEFGILEAAEIRRYLGLPDPDGYRPELIRDKVTMKQAVGAADLKIPRFMAVTSSNTAAPWSGPTVSKPRRGASSEGITIWPDPASALKHCRAKPDAADFEVEEFISGDIFHADGIVRNGVVKNLVVSKYINKPLDYISGAPLGSVQQPYDAGRHGFVQNIVDVLKISVGALHLEFFEGDQVGRVFLEVANRVGGAGVIEAHEAHTGVHLPSDEITARLGWPQPPPQRPTGKYHGWLVFPGHHLSAEQKWTLGFPSDVVQPPEIDEIFKLPEGASFPRDVTYHEWRVPAFVRASSDNAENLERLLRRLATGARIEAVS
ncbi:ATP-grasp domain-containing protein [Neokomagataea thailandica]|uniref:Nikkomycin biosynthesis protein n=1 Tax=Neokomagataea tanensis NBRC 106556 TaxID=1223519 RepID=A0ABQ0QL68_9PROT|nr:MULTISPECIES: hypothetical protein [Neokomagataea]GBR48958.1 nikkomycin biosynthesis protein [Neokomagataea tanensis NBRC 106556]